MRLIASMCRQGSLFGRTNGKERLLVDTNDSLAMKATSVWMLSWLAIARSPHGLLNFVR